MIKNLLTTVRKLGMVVHEIWRERPVKQYSIKELTDRSKPMSYEEMLKKLKE